MSAPKHWFRVITPIPDKTNSYTSVYKVELMQVVKEIIEGRGFSHYHIGRVMRMFDKRCNFYFSILIITQRKTAYDHKYLDLSLDFEDISKRFENNEHPFQRVTK